MILIRELTMAALIVGTTGVLAQTAPNYPAQNPAQQPAAPAQPPQTTPNQVISSGAPGAGNVTFTNQAGSAVSISDLANQLQNLKAAVQQTLPVLNAFNSRYAAAGTSGNGIAGALSGFLHGNGNQSQSQSGSEVSNVLSVLHGLLTTNSTTAPTSVNPNTLTQLQVLQRDLAPTLPILNSLTAGSGGFGQSGTYGTSRYGSAPYGSTPYGGANTTVNRGYAPTGR